MQEESDRSKKFLDRFELLKAKHGDSLVKACNFSGITRSLYYEIKDGKRTVSDKYWRKLEIAERKVLEAENPALSAESSADPKKAGIGETARSVREEPPIHGRKIPQRRSVDERTERMEAALTEIAEVLRRHGF